jgi:hypothetical protein
MVFIISDLGSYRSKWSSWGGGESVASLPWQHPQPEHFRDRGSNDNDDVHNHHFAWPLPVVQHPPPPSATALLLVEAEQLTNRGYAHASSRYYRELKRKLQQWPSLEWNDLTLVESHEKRFYLLTHVVFSAIKVMINVRTKIEGRSCPNLFLEKKRGKILNLTKTLLLWKSDKMLTIKRISIRKEGHCQHE